jgi:flagellar biosynthesis regulator FlaF
MSLLLSNLTRLRLTILTIAILHKKPEAQLKKKTQDFQLLINILKKIIK